MNTEGLQVGQSHIVPRQSLRAIPYIPEAVTLLTTQQINAGQFYLRRIGSHLPDHIKAHLKGLVDVAIGQLEPVPGVADRYVISSIELRGMLAGAALTGALQTAHEIGFSLTDATRMNDMLSSPSQLSDDPDVAASGK